MFLYETPWCSWVSIVGIMHQPSVFRNLWRMQVMLPITSSNATVPSSRVGLAHTLYRGTGLTRRLFQPSYRVIERDALRGTVVA